MLKLKTHFKFIKFSFLKKIMYVARIIKQRKICKEMIGQIVLFSTCDTHKSVLKYYYVCITSREINYLSLQTSKLKDWTFP